MLNKEASWFVLELTVWIAVVFVASRDPGLEFDLQVSYRAQCPCEDAEAHTVQSDKEGNQIHFYPTISRESRHNVCQSKH
jgi:hypothetical protein